MMDDAQIDPFDGILHHEEGVDLVPAPLERRVGFACKTVK